MMAQPTWTSYLLGAVIMAVGLLLPLGYVFVITAKKRSPSFGAKRMHLGKAGQF